jgi:hypothetical protein
VRFVWTGAFSGDWLRLSAAERARFLVVVRDVFHPACERRRMDPTAAWPASLRVRSVQRAPGIWEMTWSFSGPDGRATFEWVSIDGEAGIRWRRIGGHVIFGSP